MKCSHESIFRHGFDPAAVCLRIMESHLCKEEFKLLNLMNLFWCKLDGSYLIMMPIAIIALIIIFKYVSITVEEYIAEGIQAICDRLGMTDSVAAITLLAVANGAADMMTVLVSSESEGGISYNIGTLYGGGLFICSAVLAMCILQSRKKLRFNWMIIYRLIVFYLLATMITITFALFKWITWWGSALLLLLYLLLVIVVVVDDKRQAKSNLSRSMDAGSYLNVSVDDSKDRDLHQLPSRIASKIFNLHQKVVDPEYRQELLDEVPEVQSSLAQTRSTQPIARTSQPLRMNSNKNVYEYNEHHSLTQEFKLKIDFVRELRKRKISSRGAWGWVSYCLERPFMFVLYMTVLPCDKEQYSKRRCLIYCFPGVYFTMVVMTHRFDLFDLIVAEVIGALLFVFFMLTLETKRPPKYFLMINILGLLGGLLWTYVLISSMIDIIEALGILLNLNKTFLGLTVLAIGSSIPDAITTIHLCKQSESIMAISGAYSGQLFALTVAFGVSMLRLTLKEGSQEFDLFDPKKLSENSLNILVIFSNLVVLGFTFIYSIRTNFKLEKNFGKLLLAVYVLFIGTASFIGIRQAYLSF